jgi:hypothetical protein
MTNWIMILRQQILTLLKHCNTYQLPEPTLRDSLKQMMGRAVTDDEIDATLTWLNAKAYIDFTVEEISGVKRWSITENGKAKLQ